MPANLSGLKLIIGLSAELFPKKLDRSPKDGTVLRVGGTSSSFSSRSEESYRFPIQAFLDGEDCMSDIRSFFRCIDDYVSRMYRCAGGLGRGGGLGVCGWREAIGLDLLRLSNFGTPGFLRGFATAFSSRYSLTN
jgi:hypothetical protein